MRMLLTLIGLGLSGLAAGSLRGDPIIYVPNGATWSYFRGLEAPTSPPGEWREPDFDDSSWATGEAPFGYDDGPFGTDLSALNPPMEDNYSAVFLRREFTVVDASQVAGLTVEVDYDDGFLLWINGSLVLDGNVTGVPDWDGFADGNHESGTFEEYELPDPAGYLVDGTNVVAAMVLNNQISSSDLRFEIEIQDPSGPDLSPPALASIAPGPGTVVRSLSQIEITFDEAVEGVTAGDLRIDGAPALTVSGSDEGPYIFTFAELDPGAHTVGWAPAPGIRDLSPAANVFEPGADWTYQVDPDAPEAQLRIAEFLASNVSGITDEDGDRTDWIEIVNAGDTAADLGGWSLTDDPDDPARWIFPSRSLQPGERLVVFASGKDRAPGNGELHAAFQISKSSGYLGLFSNTSPRLPVSEFAPRYPDQRSDLAYGRGLGGQTGYLDPPTPGQPNPAILPVTGIAEDPVASHPRGFYLEAFDLELSSVPPDADIRYTLDGTEPTASRGTLYSGPVRVAGRTSQAVVTIKAIAFHPDTLPSEVVTFTYIFPHFVSDQPDRPQGFPTSWSGAPSVDYGMDPQVVDDPDYAGSMVDALLQIPSLSIVMPVSDLFGSSGLYSNPGQSGVRWERAGSVELLHPDGREGFAQNCGVRIQGGASRSPSKSPKHSFRLLFKGIYGPTKLRYPLFEDSPVDTFDTLILRANYNNSWIHWDSGQRRRGQMIRDQWTRDSQLAMSGLSSHGTYVHLYLNGLYWGVYNLVERPSAPFAAEHLGGEKEEYDALNSAQAVDGDTQAWSTLLNRASGNLSSLAALRNVEEYLDLDPFIDYMLVNFFGANADWPSHNWYAVRRRAPGQSWYFMSWDAERIFEGTSDNRTGASNSNSPGIVFQNLRDNADFRLRVADRAHRHLFNDGLLTPDQVEARWLRRARQIDQAVIAESARWGDYRRDVHSSSNGPYEFYRLNSHYLPEKNRLLNSYFPVRSGNFLNQLRSGNLYPNLGAPVFSQHGGQISIGFRLGISRPGGTSGTIYYTLDGTDPRVAGTGAVSGSASSYSSSIPLDGFGHVKARIRNGSTWSALTEATFFLSEDVSPLRISEIHYHPASQPESEFLELWNSGGTPLSLGGLRFTDGILFTFDEGTSLAPDERLVLVRSLTAFSADHPAVDPLGEYTGSLDNGGERLRIRDREGNEILEVEYNDGDSWPIGADGFGYSLVLREADLDPRHPESWRASASPGGNPGTTDEPAPSDRVYIHEVLPGGTGVFEDAIELINLSDVPVDVSGWYLSHDRETTTSLKRFALPGGSVIPAGGFLVLYEQDFGTGPVGQRLDLSDGGFSLYLSSASGGDLTGHIVRRTVPPLIPGLSFGRHLTSTGAVHTQLEQPTFGVDFPVSLEDFRSGTGDENSLPSSSPVVINEIHYHPAPGDAEFIELENRTGSTLFLHDLDLGRGWTLDGILGADGTSDFEFPADATIPALGRALVVGVDPAFFRGLHGVPAGVPIYGPYRGALDNGGERISLLRPEILGDSGIQQVRLDSVRYNDRAPWPVAADGAGFSLERRAPGEFADDPDSWGASIVAGGTPGEANSVSGPGGNQRPTASFTFELTGVALTVSFDASDSNDPEGPLVEYLWNFGDGASGSGREIEHTFGLPGEFTVHLQVIDSGGLSASTTRRVTLEFAGGQIPGDGNQDGTLDMADTLHLLGYLFLGQPVELPCATPEGSRLLLDANGDDFLDIGDAVTTLVYLFRDGSAPPALGTECVRIQGCPEVCSP